MADFIEIELILNVINKTDTISKDNEIDNEKLAYFRDDVRKNIFFLQENLMDKYSSTISKYIIFPLLAYVDEKVMLLAQMQNIQWNLLQLEYYDRKDGGEYVFDIIKNILSDNIYPNICYQNIELILSSNFLGKFYENPYNHDYVRFKKEIYKKVASFSESISNISNGSPEQPLKLKKSYFWHKIAFIVGVPALLYSTSLAIFAI